MIDWNSSFKIARLANIDIRLHWAMVPYAAFALAPIIARDTIYAQLLFVSTLCILLHELGHCFMAKQRGLLAKKVASLRSDQHRLVRNVGRVIDVRESSFVQHVFQFVNCKHATFCCVQKHIQFKNQSGCRTTSFLVA